MRPDPNASASPAPAGASPSVPLSALKLQRWRRRITKKLGLRHDATTAEIMGTWARRLELRREVLPLDVTPEAATKLMREVLAGNAAANIESGWLLGLPQQGKLAAAATQPDERVALAAPLEALRRPG